MKISVKPSKLSGTIQAPSSKSYTQRALLASYLSNKSNVIINPLIANDTKYLLNLFHHTCHLIDDKEVYSLKSHNLGDLIFVSESAFLARVFSVLSGLDNHNFSIQFVNTLKNRDLSDILLLEKFGMKVDIDYNNGLIKSSGKLKYGIYHLNFVNSSQLLSGLLFALPLLEANSELYIDNLVSKPYIDLTIDVLNKFSIYIENQDYRRFYIKGNQEYSSAKITVENDWSNSAFLNIAKYFNNELNIASQDYDSKQGDKIIIDNITKAKSVNYINFNAVDYPDLIPALIPLCLNLDNESRIYGINRLVNKESNRADVIINEYNKLGADIRADDDCFIISKSKLKFAEVNANKDHRIAMSLTIAGLLSDVGLILDDADCVEKSYPNFYADLISVGALINE